MIRLTRDCDVRCVREEVIEDAVHSALRPLSFGDLERRYLDEGLERLTQHWKRHAEEARSAVRLRLGKIDAKLEKLTDAFLEGVVEQDLFQERKAALLAKKRQEKEALEGIGDDVRPMTEKLRKILELADTALRTYQMANAAEKRELLGIVTSNLEAEGKKGSVELSLPFSLIANRHSVPSGVQPLTIPRSLQFLPSPAKSEDNPDRLQAWRLLFALSRSLEELRASEKARP